MKKYRLKSEAVPFILEKHATKIYDMETWKSLQINENALEEVKPIYLSFGKKTSDISNSLCGWEKDSARFEFTIHFPNIKYHEYDKFNKGNIIRGLMDEIQKKVDNYFEDFVNESEL